jgi:DNA-directed RNA polymerase subunit RPC12/RpoP
MKITMYIYASQEPPKEMTWYHCLSCKRVMFKVNSSHMLISNAYGASFKDLPPSTHYQEYNCHSCKAEYSVLYQ